MELNIIMYHLRITEHIDDLICVLNGSDLYKKIWTIKKVKIDWLVPREGYHTPQKKKNG